MLQGSNSFLMGIESWKIFLHQEQLYFSMRNVHDSKEAILISKLSLPSPADWSWQKDRDGHHYETPGAVSGVSRTPSEIAHAPYDPPG